MLRARQKLGKYRIERRIANGGFASVFEAYDTIEGIGVALKVLRANPTRNETMDAFRHEARLTSKLEHANILPIKDANLIDDHFVIAFQLGKSTLDERLKLRMGAKTALNYAQQFLDGLAHAHENNIIHCDVKPENMILFPGERLRLADFGIAKFAFKTLQGSGSGTVGYVAPEQAMGKPSYRSDVFSAGLIIYRMLAGSLPEWPFKWPAPGNDRLRRKAHPDLIAFLKKAISVEPRKRFKDACVMSDAFEKLLPKALNYATKRR